MKLSTAVVAFFAGLLAVTSMAAMAQGQGQGNQGEHGQQMARERQMERAVERDQSMEHDRLQSRDRARDQGQIAAGDKDQLRTQDRDRVQEQDRIHQGGPAGIADSDIYGHEMMTTQERNQYRQQMMDASPEEQAEIRARHREEMQNRAREQGVEPVAPGEG